MLFSLKTMESLQNEVATHFQVPPLFSMRTESLVSSQSCHSFDSDAWCIHSPNTRIWRKNLYLVDVNTCTFTRSFFTRTSYFSFQKVNVPKFRVKGRLDSTTCNITRPFTGEVIHSFGVVTIAT